MDLFNEMSGITRLFSNLNKNEDVQQELLHKSVEACHLEAVNSLLEVGVDVNCVGGSYHSTPLHSAVMNRDLKMVNLLLKYKADVNIKNERGWTPLHVLSKLNSRGSKKDAGTFDVCDKIINSLLRAGSIIEAEDCLGRTPLCFAGFHNDVNVLAALLHNGANINNQNFNKNNVFTLVAFTTPDMRAVIESHMVKLAVIEFCLHEEFDHLLGLIMQKHPNFVERCNEELQRMKSFKIGKRLSLFDVIKLEREKIQVLVGNTALRKVLNSRKFEHKYPIYGYLLKMQCHQIELEEGLVHAHNMLIRKLGLPDLCVDHIFRYVPKPVSGFVIPSQLFCRCPGGGCKERFAIKERKRLARNAYFSTL